MTRARLLYAGVALLLAGVIADLVETSGGRETTAQSTAAGAAISLRQTSLGKTLVGANGRTLYLFEGDKKDVSTLSAAGQAIWPRFTSNVRPMALNGAVSSEIGTIQGSGGTPQITYNGHPLYYFVGDRKGGETTGEGLNEFGARWYVLSSAGAAVTSPPAAPASSPSSSVGSTYGY